MRACGASGLAAQPEDAAQTGLLTSEAHLRKVEAYVAAGSPRAPGRAWVRARPGDPYLGYYFPPTVFDRCCSDMSIVQEESFGPVRTVETFTTEDEAVARANDSIFGLAGAIWTTDQSWPTNARCCAWARPDQRLPPLRRPGGGGGHKQSGIGREPRWPRPRGVPGELNHHVWQHCSAPQGW